MERLDRYLLDDFVDVLVVGVVFCVVGVDVVDILSVVKLPIVQQPIGR